jgi:hypothetical protein
MLNAKSSIFKETPAWTFENIHLYAELGSNPA